MEVLKMKNEKTYSPLMVSITSLQEMTGLSKNKAMQLGKDADAVVRLGIRRTLYNVQKVQSYIDSRTGAE